MGRDAWARVLPLVGVVLVALVACKKKSDSAAAASQSAAPPPAPAPATSIAPAVEPSATAQASASAAPTKPATAAKAAAAAPKAEPKAAASAEPAKVAARSVSAGYQNIQRCCNALAAAAKKPGLTRNQYEAASAVCAGIAAQVKKGKVNPTAAHTTIRAQLHGVPVPGGC